MASKRDNLVKELKRRWMSNWEMCDYVFSAHADRLGRDIKSNPPAGYKLKDKPCKYKPSNLSKTINFKRFKLVRNK